MEYKYPYISDKNMYAAVMGACSYIRKTGWFNKAVAYYAKKYRVDQDELEKHIRARQGAGQKANNANNRRKYSWFAVEYCMALMNDDGVIYDYHARTYYEARKGISAETVRNTMRKGEGNCLYQDPFPLFGRIEKCETEQDANAKLRTWMAQDVHYDMMKGWIAGCRS